MTKVIDFTKEKQRVDTEKLIGRLVDAVQESRAKIEENPWPYISRLEGQGLLMLTILADIETIVYSEEPYSDAERLAFVKNILDRVI